MHCSDVQRDIDEFLDGTLEETRQAEVRKHLESCDSCRQTLEGTRQLRSALREIPAPAPRRGFLRKALRQARRAHRQPRGAGAPGWFAAGFGSAAAAGLVAWLVLAPVGPGQGPGPTPATDRLPTVELAPGRTESVRLAFDAPERLEGARLTMRLPENFELASHPGRRELTWTTELEAGRNLLELPVRALAGGDGELVAEIAHGDTVQRLSIRLRAAGPAAFLAPNPVPAA